VDPWDSGPYILAVRARPSPFVELGVAPFAARCSSSPLLATTRRSARCLARARGCRGVHQFGGHGVVAGAQVKLVVMPCGACTTACGPCGGSRASRARLGSESTLDLARGAVVWREFFTGIGWRREIPFLREPARAPSQPQVRRHALVR
jgi:hypothetical protein